MQIKYKLSNVLFEDTERAIQHPLLYVRAAMPVLLEKESGNILLTGASTFDFTTYFNSFSLEKWKKYTVIQNVYLHVEYMGAPFDLTLNGSNPFSIHPDPIAGSTQAVGTTESMETLEIELPFDSDDVIVGFSVTTEGSLTLGNCYYYALIDESILHPVNLAIATTTFRKEEFITGNLEMIQDKLLSSDEPIADHLWVHVVDNGRSLDVDALSTDRIFIHPNGNSGGSGGFARGMIEALRQDPTITNVLLMDDDISINPESILRTFVLLTLLNDEYKDAFINGAMLDFEIADVQHEDIGSITVDGRFAPVKPPLKVSSFRDIVINETIEIPEDAAHRTYSAWWYCCIPASTIMREGLPLPIFVRGDDSEYGMRCQPKIITMNGICVWHLNFYAKYSGGMDLYQPIRNTLIAQATTGMAKDADLMGNYKRNFVKELRKFNYTDAELMLSAIEDFMKGPDFIAKPIAEERFMWANKAAEQKIPFDELQKQLDELGIDLDLNKLTIADVKWDTPRSRTDRAYDLITKNGQKTIFAKDTKGVAVIGVESWDYPAGKIHMKDTVIAIDPYNRKGVLRRRDAKRFKEIMKRYKEDMAYYKKNKRRIESDYAAKRDMLTSFDFWKDYLGID